MAVLVQRVVGELELEEGHRLLHPVAPRSRRVRVEVGPAGRLGLRFSRHLPFLFIPLQEGDKDEVGRSVGRFVSKHTDSPAPLPTAREERVCQSTPPTETEEVGGSPPQQEIEKQEEIAAFDVLDRGGGGRLVWR